MDENNTENETITSPVKPANTTTADNIPIALDSSNQADPINDNPEVIQFQNGNFKLIDQVSDALSQKRTTIVNTVLPLIEAALIELSGNSGSYSRKDFNCSFSITNEVKVSVSVIYNIPLFISNDVPKENIMHDAEYILNKIKIVRNVIYTKCQIDCATGDVSIDFIC